MKKMTQDNGEKHWWLYVLKCKEGKMYVGITSKTPERRLEQHRQKRGAYWTMKYEPESIAYREYLGDITKELAEKRENAVTREYMKEYGLNNVRGGDLRDTAEYVLRFGYILDKEGWKDILYLVFLLICFVVFFVDKYVVNFIPGHPLFH